MSYNCWVSLRSTQPTKKPSFLSLFLKKHRGYVAVCMAKAGRAGGRQNAEAWEREADGL